MICSVHSSVHNAVTQRNVKMHARNNGHLTPPTNAILVTQWGSDNGFGLPATVAQGCICSKSWLSQQLWLAPQKDPRHLHRLIVIKRQKKAKEQRQLIKDFRQPTCSDTNQVRCVKVHQLREVCDVGLHLFPCTSPWPWRAVMNARAQHADVTDINRALWLCCHSALLAEEITQCRALLCWHSVLVQRRANPVNYCLAPARHCSPVSQHMDTTACRESSKQTALTFDCSATSTWRCCIVIEHCFALWPHFDRCLLLPHWGLFLLKWSTILSTQDMTMVTCENVIHVFLQENISELMTYKCLNLAALPSVNKLLIYFVVKEDFNTLWGFSLFFF